MRFAAFSDQQLLFRGPLEAVLAELQDRARDPASRILFIQESTGRSVDFDWRGSLQEVVQRAQAQFSPGKSPRGRPKLGVQSREITLLPRHWSWLDRQRGPRSAVLRRLVDDAMQKDQSLNVDAIYGALSTLAGDLPGFEEASRCLFAGDWEKFAQLTKPWPESLREYFQTRIHEDRQKG